jgi:rare lipoprotein A
LALVAVALVGCSALPDTGHDLDTPPRYAAHASDTGDDVEIYDEPDIEVRRKRKARTSRPYTIMEKTYVPMRKASGHVEEGLASWYGPKFHGRPTATGEAFDMYRLTAAHTTLPLPSKARITNLDNGQSLVVRVNDRGPFVSGRFLDLSYAAAKKLGYLEKGVTRVRLEVLDDGMSSAMADAAPAEPPVLASTKDTGGKSSSSSSAGEVLQVRRDVEGHFVNVGVFDGYSRAERMASDLQSLGPVEIQKTSFQKDHFFRVRMGPFAKQGEALRLARQLEHDQRVVTPTMRN